MPNNPQLRRSEMVELEKPTIEFLITDPFGLHLDPIFVLADAIKGGLMKDWTIVAHPKVAREVNEQLDKDRVPKDVRPHFVSERPPTYPAIRHYFIR